MNSISTSEFIIGEFAKRIRQKRIQMGLTQEEIAKQSGVGKRTLERIEKGSDMQFSTLIRLLQVLGLGEQLERLIPELPVSPIETFKNNLVLPKRVRHRKKTKDINTKSWKWGDEK